jgi:hypothetical protein
MQETSSVGNVMRSSAIAIICLFAMATATTTHAAVPNPVVPLLGRSVGYLLSQSELCQWGLTEKIKQTYQDAFKAIGMTAPQQATAWEQAMATQKRMVDIPNDAKARMKADTCTPASRADVERDLTD